MLKSITKIGNSQGLILDAALLELSGLRVGDQVNITVHEGGAITLTPVRRTASPEAVTFILDRGWQCRIEPLWCRTARARRTVDLAL